MIGMCEKCNVIGRLFAWKIGNKIFYLCATCKSKEKAKK